MAHVIAAVVGLGLGMIALADAFQTVVVARHAQSLPTLTHRFYQLTWIPVAGTARLMRSERRRDRYLGLYGPLSLLLLLALWAGGLMVAFGLLQWSVDRTPQGDSSSLAHELYFSASSFFTLGSSEPHGLASKYLMVFEAGLGFSFLGLVIGNLPVLYQSYSSRELRILLLDARAGSPPSALQFILRRGPDPARLGERLADWEEWALDLLQSHLSYPMLAFYRSQHRNQSWLAALTAVADVSALVMLSGGGDLERQARFTFAAARHALAHTASIFQTPPPHRHLDRLPAPDLAELRRLLAAGITPLRAERIEATELAKLRTLYEPSAHALAVYFLMTLPPWIATDSVTENWQTTSWGL